MDSSSTRISSTDSDFEMSTPPVTLTEQVEPFPLMSLPYEIRSKILGYLLPSALEIIPSNISPDCVAHVDNVPFRPQGERCYTSILRTSRQLYSEGTAVLYNRAFRIILAPEEFSFLGLSYRVRSHGRPRFRKVERSNPLLRGLERLALFPFHKAKQIQIQIWTSVCQLNLYILMKKLVGLCFFLNKESGLKNVRVDFYDWSYHPPSRAGQESVIYDNDEAHPAQDRFAGQMEDVIQEDCYQVWGRNFEKYGRLRSTSPVARKYNLPDSLREPLHQKLDLDLALRPLKQLRNIARARINLTSAGYENAEMRRKVTECQDAMMSSGPQDQTELDFMKQFYDPYDPWIFLYIARKPPGTPGSPWREGRQGSSKFVLGGHWYLSLSGITGF